MEEEGERESGIKGGYVLLLLIGFPPIYLPYLFSFQRNPQESQDGSSCWLEFSANYEVAHVCFWFPPTF